MNDTAVKAVSAMSTSFCKALFQRDSLSFLCARSCFLQNSIFISRICGIWILLITRSSMSPSWGSWGRDTQADHHTAVRGKIFCPQFHWICLLLNCFYQWCHLCLLFLIMVPVSRRTAELNRSIEDFKTARHSFGLLSISYRLLFSTVRITDLPSVHLKREPL